MTVNYDEFEVVAPVARKQSKQVISIFENGDFVINAELAKALKTNRFEVRIKSDCSQILLMPDGKIMTDMGKNNRTKNYAIIERLTKQKVKFPIYYVGCLDGKQNWIGELVTKNPNKHVGKVVK